MTRPTSGPMAEMMARAGYSADHIRRTGETFRANFCEPGSIGQGVMHDHEARTFVRSFRELARAMDMAAMDEQEWVVEVDVTDRTVVDGAFVVDTYGFVILAPNHHEARLAAFEWVIWLVDELCTGENMIVATRIID